MKWVFYVIVFVYMLYRAVYGKNVEPSLAIEQINYGDDGFLKVGTDKSINCKATKRNQQVEWVDKLGNVVKRKPGGRIFAHEHFVTTPRGGRIPALVLTLNKLLVSDSGVYQCRSGDLKQNISVCVIEPSHFVKTPTEVSSDLGRSITLSCQATGDPEPRIMWTRNGEILSDDDSSSKYRVMTKYNSQGFEGLLTISSLEPEDSGVYSCVSIQESSSLEDCSHMQNMNISLEVSYAPFFEDGNNTKFVYGKNNQGVEIICSANGSPPPTYKWLTDVSDDTSLEFNKKQVKISEKENQAVLTVTANPSTFGQMFKCQATNQHGRAEKVFTLLRIEKPIKPSELSLYNSTDKEIELNVTWYDEILFPIEEFDIQYLHAAQNEGRRKVVLPRESEWRKSAQFKAKVDDESGGVIFKDGEILVTLPDLQPETEYWVRLRATNDAGESPWSDPILASTIVQDEVVEEPEEAEVVKEQTEKTAMTIASNENGAFYGIFFAGGIIIVAIASMFAIRLV